ncbi:hypothetical protein [Streptomyces sp. NPDC094149]|uniref:hypothetical protein n=1 Tax=Streptomyces sp. NPDC094149 TaxID=3155079 RepID=UPI00332E25B2
MLAADAVAEGATAFLDRAPHPGERTGRPRLGALPTDTEACKQWIAIRQSVDGGFSRTPGGPSETTDEGFIAVQALHMLEGKLNRSWAVMMT